MATIGADGGPHLVPVTFAVRWPVLFSAVDAKPKTTRRLRRLANIEASPRVSLLADHYAEDWSTLWWVRVDGTAEVRADARAVERAQAALAEKYQQYRRSAPEGPVIIVTVERVTGWSASG
jgi:PPOX class probable F420-dependent enzyme